MDLTGGAVGFLAAGLALLATSPAYRKFRKDSLSGWSTDDVHELRGRITLASPGIDRGWEKERLRIVKHPRYGLWVERIMWACSVLLLIGAVLMFAFDSA